jgi:hypothetical protein
MVFSRLFYVLCASISTSRKYGSHSISWTLWLHMTIQKVKVFTDWNKHILYSLDITKWDWVHVMATII